MSETYVILKKIGSGSFSEVFLVEKISEKYILKKFHPQYQEEARREFLFLSMLQIPRIVRAIDFLSDENAILLEYIEGIKLSELNACEEAYVNYVVSGIADLLFHLHSSGVCVNDLKPENIIIKDALPHLIDFDLATTQNYYDGLFRGTLAFCSPEKYLKNINSSAGDIFSLGIISLSLHKNNKISREKEFPELLKNEDIWNSYVSSLIEDDFIKQMLSYKPSLRPDAHEVMEYFSGKCSYSPLPPTEALIKGFFFSEQVSAAIKLNQNHFFECSINDEPEKIYELFILNREYENKLTILIDTTELLSDPSVFFKKLSFRLKTDIANWDNLISYINEKSEQVFVLKESLYSTHTSVLEKYKNLINVFIISVSNKKTSIRISLKELSSFLKKVEVNTSLSEKITLANKEISPAILRMLAIQNTKDLTEIPKNISLVRQVLGNVHQGIPYEVLNKTFHNWTSVFQYLALQGEIVIRDSEIYLLNREGTELSIEVAALFSEMVRLINNGNYLLLSSEIYFILGDTEKALEMWQKNLEQLCKSGYYNSAFDSFEWLSDFYNSNSLSLSIKKRKATLARLCGELELSLQIYDEIEKSSDQTNRAVILSDKAIVCQEMKKYDQAESLYLKSLEIFEKIPDSKSLLRTINNLGTMYFLMSEIKRSEKQFLELYEKAALYEDNFYMTVAYYNLSDVNHVLGNWNKSIFYAEEILKKKGSLKKQMIISVQLIILKNNLALGNITGLEEKLTSLISDSLIEENEELKESLNNFLCYLTILNKDNVKKENKDETFKESKEYFFRFYLTGKVKRAISMIEKIKKKEDREILEIVANGDESNLKKMLEGMYRADRISDLAFYSTCIQLSSNFLNLSEFISKFDQRINYYPLSNLTAKERIQTADAPMLVLWKTLGLIHRSLNFNDTMNAVMKALLEITGLEKAIYYSFENGEFIIRMGFYNIRSSISSKEEKDKIIQMSSGDFSSLRISSTILKDTVKLGDIRFLSHLHEDIPFNVNSSIIGLGLRSAVCFPLIMNHEIKGVVYSDARGDKEFSENDKTLIESIFVQARFAFEKAIQYENLKEEKENLELKGGEQQFPEIIGESKEMLKIFALMKTIGKHNVNVLITGSTGTGKELVARALHIEYNKKSPFVAVNCAAIPENLMESELFGYKKGAFTGAVTDRKGLIQMADTGTLFLDEIGDLPIYLQAKLLRVIQERKFVQVGGSEQINVSIRIIAATNQNLQELVEKKEFREDLFFRLKVIEIKIPQLTDRCEDIPILVRYFADKYGEKYKKKIDNISPELMKILQRRKWKGNVRELENEIERAVILAETNHLSVEHFDFGNDLKEERVAKLPLDWKEYLQYKKNVSNMLDKRYVEQLLSVNEQNFKKASETAKIERKQIYRLIKKGV